MTHSFTIQTTLADSKEAGTLIGSRIREEFKDRGPDVVILFASPRYDYPPLLEAIQSSCKSKHLVGCSSAGEFFNGGNNTGSALAIAISSQDMFFNVSVGRNLRTGRAQAAREVVSRFRSDRFVEFPYRSALILTDALAGEADTLIEDIIAYSAGSYDLIGGGAADDGQFKQTHVFDGTQVITDAVLALEILSKKPLGVGLYHGWRPASEPMRVTSAKGNALISLNAVPTFDMIKAHATQTNQHLDLANPLPFLMNNVLGIRTERGHKIRVPLGVMPDGTLICAAEIPQDSVVQFMQTSVGSYQEAANAAISRALGKLGGHRPNVVLFFDCVATRLRTSEAYDDELKHLSKTLGKIPFAGLNTYGQIARTEGQFLGFHNSTTAVFAIPE